MMVTHDFSHLTLRDVSLDFHGEAIFSDLTFTVGPRELVFLLGQNGAGKSSLLRVIAGRIPPTSGEVQYGGRPALRTSGEALSRARSFVPQRLDGPLPPFTVLEFFSLTPSNAMLEPAILEYVTSCVSLGPILHRHLRTLSGGELQRVLIAGALLQDSSIILLDEPTSAFDPGREIPLARALRGFCETFGRSIIWSTHSIELARRFGTSMMLLSQGARPTVLSSPHTFSAAQASALYDAPFSRIPMSGDEYVIIPSVG